MRAGEREPIGAAFSDPTQAPDRWPVKSSATPPITNSPPSTGGRGSVCFSSFVAWMGPTSTTFFCVVTLIPWYANDKIPNTIKTIPASVALFIE